MIYFITTRTIIYISKAYYAKDIFVIPKTIIEEEEVNNYKITHTTHKIYHITTTQHPKKNTVYIPIFFFRFSGVHLSNNPNQHEHDIPHLHLRYQEEKILLKNRSTETLQIQHLTKIKCRQQDLCEHARGARDVRLGIRIDSTDSKT